MQIFHSLHRVLKKEKVALPSANSTSLGPRHQTPEQRNISPPQNAQRDSFVQGDASRRLTFASIGKTRKMPQPLDVEELRSDFSAQMQSLPKVAFDEIVQQASTKLNKNSLPQAAEVRLVDRALLDGADGAYLSREGGTILLASDLDSAGRRATYREEAGHHLDEALGGIESPGEEGAIFAEGVAQEGALADASDIKNESDQGRVVIDGKQESVEFRRRYTRSIATRDASRAARGFVDEMNKHDRAWSAFTDGKIASPGSQPWADIAAATNPTDPFEAGTVAGAMAFARAISRGRTRRRLMSIAKRSGLNPREQNTYARNIIRRAERTKNGTEAASRFSYLLKNKT